MWNIEEKIPYVNDRILLKRTFYNNNYCPELRLLHAQIYGIYGSSDSYQLIIGNYCHDISKNSFCQLRDIQRINRIVKVLDNDRKYYNYIPNKEINDVIVKLNIAKEYLSLDKRMKEVDDENNSRIIKRIKI